MGGKRETVVAQNLADAGCDERMIRRCLALWETNQRGALLEELCTWRAALLEAVHKSEDRLTCLDYLIYQLKREGVCNDTL